MGKKALAAGAKRPTISDVAELAGVSTAAVSKVMRDAYGVSPLMKAKVEAAIKKLGYRPRPGARGMRGQTQLIGIQVPNFGNLFFTQIFEGVQEKLNGTQFQVVIAPPNSGESGLQTLEALLDHQVDGIIAIAPDCSPTDLLRIAREAPLVMIGRHDSSHEYDSVYGDDAAGTLAALDFLYDQGHRKIAHVTIRTTFESNDAKSPHRVRLETYENFMKTKGLPSSVTVAKLEGPEFSERVQALLESHDRPTAVFAGHDELAMETLRVISSLGLTVNDVSVIGYDDSYLASHPLINLTTVRQFGEQIGKKAAELLLEKISGERESANHLSVGPKLIIRSTTPTPKA